MEGVTEFIRLLLILAALATQEYAPDHIVHAFGLEGFWEQLGVKALCALSLLAVIAVIQQTMNSRMMYAVRRRFGRLRRFEGVWEQVTSVAARPYSLGFIRFVPRERKWEYSGVGLGGDFAVAAQWRVQSLRYEEPHWFFAGEGSLLVWDQALQHWRESGGSGMVALQLDLPSNPDAKVDGIVTDIEVGGQTQAFRIVMRKLPDKLAKRFPDAERLRNMSREDVETLFKAHGLFVKPGAGGGTAP